MVGVLVLVGVPCRVSRVAFFMAVLSEAGEICHTTERKRERERETPEPRHERMHEPRP